MNREKALEILRKYSPMPDDDELTQEIVNEYGAAIDFFRENPDPACIEPIIMSFGKYDGWGLYEDASDVLQHFSREEMVPFLAKAIRFKHGGIRYWATHLASDFPHSELIDDLVSCLKDSHADIRQNTAIALEFIGKPIVLKPLKDALMNERDPDVKESIKKAIKNLEDSYSFDSIHKTSAET